MKCPNCSAELKFSAKDKQVKCEYCGSLFKPEDLKEKKVSKSKKQKAIDAPEGHSYQCNECGAKLLTFDDTAVTFCSYCGSQAILEDKFDEGIDPKFIIPFGITKEQAIAKYISKVNKSMFAPKYLKDTNIVNKFRGIYMPYGVYHVGHHGPTRNKGEKYDKRVGDYVYYNQYSISADVNTEYTGITYDLSSKFYDAYSQAVRHNFKNAVPFEYSYLAGFYVDSPDVPEEVYAEDAAEEVAGDAGRKMAQDKIFSKHGCSNPVCSMSLIEVEKALLPVYFMSFKDKDGKNIHYAVVNAETGDVTFDTPISYIKYIIFAFIAALLLFLLIDNFFVFTPKTLLIVTAIISFICIFISNNRLNRIKDKENLEDDKGYMAVKDGFYPHAPKKKKQRKGKFKYLFKPILATIIAIIACLIPGLIQDEILYIANIVSFVFLLLCFIDLLKEHNMICKRKLPQLEKRGGLKNE